jgi:hypothetical protein
VLRTIESHLESRQVSRVIYGAIIGLASGRAWACSSSTARLAGEDRMASALRALIGVVLVGLKALLH